MEKAVPVSSTPVPPYEPNPQYVAPPQTGYSQHAPQPLMMQQDSYQIQQATGPQGQHPQPTMTPVGYQQQGVASPDGEVKQAGYFVPTQQQQNQQQAPVMPQQQQQPIQPQQSQYRVGVPLSNLQDTAAPVDCPQCGTRAMTNISFESGNTTHMWALAACCIFLLGCIPYLITATKDVTHKCSHCGVSLAKFHRSGRTVVLAHS